MMYTVSLNLVVRKGVEFLLHGIKFFLDIYWLALPHRDCLEK